MEERKGKWRARGTILELFSIKLRGTCRDLSFPIGLLTISRCMELIHFFDFRDHNRVRPVPLKYDSASPHVFADEGHQFLPLISVRHFVGDGQIQVTILGQNNKRRTTPHAFHHAFGT